MNEDMIKHEFKEIAQTQNKISKTNTQNQLQFSRDIKQQENI